MHSIVCVVFVSVFYFDWPVSAIRLGIKKVASFSDSIYFSIRKIGHESFSVAVVRLRWSVQKRSDPSSSRLKTTGAARSICDGLMMFSERKL